MEVWKFLSSFSLKSFLVIICNLVGWFEMKYYKLLGIPMADRFLLHVKRRFDLQGNPCPIKRRDVESNCKSNNFLTKRTHSVMFNYITWNVVGVSLCLFSMLSSPGFGFWVPHGTLIMTTLLCIEGKVSKQHHVYLTYVFSFQCNFNGRCKKVIQMCKIMHIEQLLIAKLFLCQKRDNSYSFQAYQNENIVPLNYWHRM